MKKAKLSKVESAALDLAEGQAMFIAMCEDAMKSVPHRHRTPKLRKTLRMASKFLESFGSLKP